MAAALRAETCAVQEAAEKLQTQLRERDGRLGEAAEELVELRERVTAIVDVLSNALSALRGVRSSAHPRRRST